MPLPPLHAFDRAGTSALGALDFVDQLQAEVVHASTELAYVLGEHVVCDDRRDCGEESSGSGDERLGDARRYRAQSCSTRRTQSVKGVDDAPHRSEEPDEWRNRSGSRQPGQAAFQASQFFRSGDLRRALQGRHTDGVRTLLAQLFVRAFKDGHQRAGPELIRYGSDVLQSLRLAKGAHESVALHTGASEKPPFGENDGP